VVINKALQLWGKAVREIIHKIKNKEILLLKKRVKRDLIVKKTRRRIELFTI
jgi:hypothetical protein